MEKKKLTDEQVRALTVTKVEDNERIVGLHFKSGYYGRGGSNSAPYTSEVDAKRTLEEIAGKPFEEFFGVEVRAVVGDTVYLTDGTKVISFGEKGRYTDEYGIAYDTYRGYMIEPIIKAD